MSGREFGGSLDNHLTPDDPEHDWTEDMPRSEFREYLMVWFDCATRAEQEAVTEFINARKAREFLDNLP